MEERRSIPADLERKQQEAGPKKAEVPPAKPFLAKGDYDEIAGLMQKVRDLQFDEVVIRRRDLNLSLRAAGMQAGQVTGAARADTMEAV